MIKFHIFFVVIKFYYFKIRPDSGIYIIKNLILL